jgi:hypothetical protein
MEEIWKPIKDFPKYEVSNYGRVRSYKYSKCRIMKQNKVPSGYFDIQLSMSGKIIHKLIHRLVIEAFVGECPDNMEASHIDGNRENNHADNLIWESHVENHRRGCSIKLNYLKASWIRLLYKRGWKQHVLAEKFGVSRENIYGIRHNLIWKEGSK